jgi:hypothetical protein
VIGIVAMLVHATSAPAFSAASSGGSVGSQWTPRNRRTSSDSEVEMVIKDNRRSSGKMIRESRGAISTTRRDWPNQN